MKPVAAAARKAGRRCSHAGHRQDHCKKTSHDRVPSSALPPYMRDLITPADYDFSRIAMVGAVLRPFPAGA
jgi:hypothetical protein